MFHVPQIIPTHQNKIQISEPNRDNTQFVNAVMYSQD